MSLHHHTPRTLSSLKPKYPPVDILSVRNTVLGFKGTYTYLLSIKWCTCPLLHIIKAPKLFFVLHFLYSRNLERYYEKDHNRNWSFSSLKLYGQTEQMETSRPGRRYSCGRKSKLEANYMLTCPIILFNTQQINTFPNVLHLYVQSFVSF